MKEFINLPKDDEIKTNFGKTISEIPWQSESVVEKATRLQDQIISSIKEILQLIEKEQNKEEKVHIFNQYIGNNPALKNHLQETDKLLKETGFTIKSVSNRAVGNTTRQIDEAIQVLFTKGYVIVKDHSGVEEGTRDLIRRLDRRLHDEHNISVVFPEYYLKMQYGFAVIGLNKKCYDEAVKQAKSNYYEERYNERRR